VPTVGIAGAPLLGIVFGLGWTPCIGPTLGAVVALEFQGGTSTQGALLAFVYCLGLGLPFILGGLLYQRALGVFGFLRRHALWVLRFGGGLLIVVGVLLVTGLWTHFSNWLLHLYPGYSTPL
jgi:cytochrome c-type biogenesis protein